MAPPDLRTVFCSDGLGEYQSPWETNRRAGNPAKLPWVWAGQAALAAYNSQIAAAVALLTWMIIDWVKMKRPSLVGCCVGHRADTRRNVFSPVSRKVGYNVTKMSLGPMADSKFAKVLTISFIRSCVVI